MDKDALDSWRTELRRAVRKDYLYLGARDVQRHFDPISLAAGFGTALLLAFVKAAGEKLGDDLWQVVHRLLGSKDGVTTDDSEQLAQVGAAKDALQLLQSRLSEDRLRAFIAAGEQGLERRLLEDDFPANKAKRIASAIGRVVEERLQL